jgi:hypothetical protein
MSTAKRIAQSFWGKKGIVGKKLKNDWLAVIKWFYFLRFIFNPKISLCNFKAL